MKRLEVNVCVCTQCVMNGAMDIVEAIESLQKLKTQLRFNASVKVNASESLCDRESGDVSPLVIINHERLERVTSEQVMAKIISMVSRD